MAMERNAQLSLYIMRHGRTEWNIQGKLQGGLNSPLLPESHTTTMQIAHWLKDKGICTIYSSPLQRCVETAEIISQVFSVPFITDDRLVECDHGLCEGMSLEDARSKYAGEFRAREDDKWNVPWPKGESYADVFARATAFAGVHPDNALVIAHETFNKCLIGYLANWDSESIMRFRQSNSSVIIMTGNVFEMVDINEEQSG
jgi:probable phosphoglycerate mutase